MLYGTMALAECNLNAVQNPQYAALMANRPSKKHRVIEIGNGIFFEYWSKDEWEFTVINPALNVPEVQYTVFHVVSDVSRMSITPNRIPDVIKLATQRFAKYL